MSTRVFPCTRVSPKILVLLATSLILAGQTPGSSQKKANFDALAQMPAERSLHKRAPEFVRPGTAIHKDERLGVPTFFWSAFSGAGTLPTVPPGQQAEGVIARFHLARHAVLYGLQPRDLSRVVLHDIHNLGKGPVIVTFRNAVDGIEVYQEEIKIMMNQDLEALALSGYLMSTEGVAKGTFAIMPTEAIARAIEDLTGTRLDASQFAQSSSNPPYDYFTLAPLGVTPQGTARVEMRDPAHVKRVYYRFPDHLEPAYDVEFVVRPNVQKEWLAYAYVIGASDGRLLARTDRTSYARKADTYSYRVWADANGLPFAGPHGAIVLPPSPPTPGPSIISPPFIAPNLVTLRNGPISTKTPWLPARADTTVGNNVDAFANLTDPDGFQPNTNDRYPYTTSVNTFDRVYDIAKDPLANTTQTDAATVQLFYTLNFLHDWFYDSGFQQQPSLIAEAQSVDRRNNGSYGGGYLRINLFDGPEARFLQASGAISAPFRVGFAVFGPKDFDVTAPVSLTHPTDGCSAITEDLTGKIALMDGTYCTLPNSNDPGFVLKTRNAIQKGAVGVLIANPDAGQPVPWNLWIDNVDTSGINIPILGLDYKSSSNFRNALSGGSAVNARLFRDTTATDRDGDLDGQLIAHEWGHYLVEQLTPSGNYRYFGEGWADFVALLMTARGTDVMSPSNTSFNGVYPIFVYSTGDYYFGTRRAPYSTDFTKNPFTFKQISRDTPLPTSVPIGPAALQAGGNLEVHNAGEIWAQMLWECYASLLRDTLGTSPRLTFEDAQARMKSYLVASLKMTPSYPTLLEARDALLAVAYATDGNDFANFWHAFAKRGAGSSAVGPDRSDYNNLGIVESNAVPVGLTIVDAVLTESKTCDKDGLLDIGETGILTVTVRNTGVTALNATTLTVKTDNPYVVFPAGSGTTFPPMPSGSTIQKVSLPVTLSPGPGPTVLDFSVIVNDPGLSGPVTKNFWTYGNADSLLRASASDDVEAPVTAWSVAIAAGTQAWARVQVGSDWNPSWPFNYVWHGPDTAYTADRYLISPPLKVGSEPFAFSFLHRYSFGVANYYPNIFYYDGGVIELSADGGRTWVDIGVGYNQSIDPYNPYNPLIGRPAYAGDSPGYPVPSAQVINLGTAYADQTVRIRFRIGEGCVGICEPNPGGWDIDNLVFNGITNTPFTALVRDPGCKSKPGKP